MPTVQILSNHARDGIASIIRSFDRLSPSTSSTVGIREFILSPDYCGDTSFWPAALDELEILLSPQCRGAVIEKGIRGSKSYTACYIPVYLTYLHIHDEYIGGADPRIKYGLDPESTVIYNAIFTITATLAKRLFFYISSFVDRCAWFRRPEVASKIKRNPDVKSEVQFCPIVNGRMDKTRPRYVAYPGTSKLTSAAGVALYSYILDECNLFTVADTSGADHAADLDEELDKRVSSSFGHFGKRIYISRREIDNDFTQRKAEAWQRDPDWPTLYHIPPPKTSWADWPMSRNTAEPWRLFDTETLSWARDTDGIEMSPVQYDQIDDQMWVPSRFWSDFTTDPEGSLKVLASIPAGASCPFFRKSSLVRPDFELENPLKPSTRPEDWMADIGRDDRFSLWDHFDSLVEDWFRGERGEYYHFHVDLALSRSASGDAAGLAVVRNAGVDDVAYIDSEGRPERCVLVDAELILQIKAPPGGEVVFSRVREIIYWLHRHRGFRFLASSYDGWQSVDSIQTLSNEGYNVDVLSVDGSRSLLHYNTLKQGLYEGRVAIPPAHGQTPETTRAELVDMAKKGDASAVLQVELLQLELVKGRKVDHPSHGSKDVADALCGAVSHAVAYIRHRGAV